MPSIRNARSQFYLVHGRTFSKVELLNIEARNSGPGVDAGEPFKYPDAAIERYMTGGGTLFLDNNYTVFGYVVDGLNHRFGRCGAHGGR